MVVVGTYAGNYTGKPRKCRYMVVGIIPFVHKGHLCRELNPCIEPCTYIPCISLHGSLCGLLSLQCTYIPCIPCVGSIPCMGDLFVLGTLSQPPCTYIPCVGPHHYHVPTFPALLCKGSIPCVGDLLH